MDSILKMLWGGMVKGMDVIGKKTIEGSTHCSECKAASHHRNPIPSETHTCSDRVLGQVFSDVCEVQTITHEGFKYFITFIDDFSRFLTVYPMKNKSDALEKFKEYLAEAERQTSCRLKTLRTYGGGEYFSSEFNSYLKSIGITHESTNPCTPQENGVAERVNRTLVTMAIAMLKSVESKVGRTAWPYTIRHATLIKNVSPHSSLPDSTSPYERYTGNKPSISMICTFGCEATLHIHRDLCNKLDNCSIPGIHIGIAQGKKAFLVYDPQTRKVHESRDVHFFENTKSVSERVTIEVEPYDSPTHMVVPTEEDDVINAGDKDERMEVDEEMDSPDATPELKQSEPCRSGRICRMPIPDHDAQFEKSTYNCDHNLVGITQVLMAEIKIPHTYEDAMNRPDSDSWLEACAEELGALRETNTYVPVRVSEADPHNIVGCQWVFAIKKNANGEVERYKVHIVAKGFNQIYAIDYDETFAPVVKWSSIRILLTLATQSDLEVHQMDVKMV